MAYINFQPCPKVPPIGFFEPISVDPKDMMTDVEFLLGVLKKLNEIIAQTNKNTEFIDEYTGKIEEIEAEIVALRSEFETFKTDVDNNIALQFAQIKVELQAMVATVLNQANAYTDAIASQLRQEIEQISVGDITLYDPTTGVLSSLQTVIDNLYGTTREEALMASEYDNLLLSATEYDTFDNGEPLTAFNYDKFGKTLLV